MSQWSRADITPGLSPEIDNHYREISNLQSLDRWAKSKSDVGLGVGVVTTLLAIDHLAQNTRYGRGCEMIKSIVGCTFHATMNSLSKLGVCPPPSPRTLRETQSILWKSGGYIEGQLQNQRNDGIAKLIEQRRTDAGCARLIVGGCSPRNSSIPFSLSRYLEGIPPLTPADITLNIDAFESPDVWGNIATKSTMQLFPDASLREIVFEYVGESVFTSEFDRTEADVLELVQKFGLLERAKDVKFWSHHMGAVQGRSVLESVWRALEENGQLILLGMCDLRTLNNCIIPQLSSLAFRLDVVADSQGELIEIVGGRLSGNPWHIKLNDQWPPMLVLTKQRSG